MTSEATQDQFILSDNMTALIFDADTQEFGIITPAIKNESEEQVPPQVMALVGCLIGLNSEPKFVELAMELAYSKFDQAEAMDTTPRIHIPG